MLQWLGTASLPRIGEIAIDGRVLAFSLATTAATCLVFGLVPAWRTSRIDLAETMKSGGRGTVGGGALWLRFNLSSALVVVEIGLSLVLLVGGGLLARSFIALQRVDPGFEADSQLTFRLRLSGTEYADRATRIAFNEQLEERLEAIPGIDAVGTTSILPFAQGVLWLPIGTESYVPPQGEDHQIISELRFVTPTYFEAKGIPLIRGRGFDERDRLDAAPVAMIDKSLAETYFPQRNPIGTQLRWGGAARWQSSAS